MEPELIEFRKNILLWYPFKNNCSILNLGENIDDFLDELELKIEKFDNYQNDASTIKGTKYDYIILFGKYALEEEFVQKLKIAFDYLKKDGKVLIALNNRLSLNNLNKNGNLYKNISKKEIENVIQNLNYKYSKFYYAFPNYENANLIYSDDYKLTKEDISRNFFVYEKDATINFNENEVYTALLEQGEEYVNTFANSFFIEISNSKIDTDIKYVSYSNYRKEKYRTMTIISSKNVIKKSANEKSKEHLKKMAEYLEDLKKQGIQVIEVFDGEKLSSKFIKETRFDNELQNVSNVKEFMQKYQIIQKVLEKNLVSYESLINELGDSGNIKECIRNYDENKLKKLRFMRKAYLDFVPKNCFIIHGKILMHRIA